MPISSTPCISIVVLAYHDIGFSTLEYFAAIPKSTTKEQRTLTTRGYRIDHPASVRPSQPPPRLPWARRGGPGFPTPHSRARRRHRSCSRIPSRVRSTPPRRRRLKQTVVSVAAPANASASNVSHQTSNNNPGCPAAASNPHGGRVLLPRHPKLYTLRPTPNTLHPAPYTIHPTPYTLHPAP